MDEATRNLMISRYEKEISHAEEMIDFIDRYRFVIRSTDDTRPDAEVIADQKQMHTRLISSYTQFIDALKRTPTD